ncbi:Bax inhibitor-1/YccA family protein [Prevotella sp. Rep29]|uniref:Bax inhibitor-1/YccA family protein n=1 Tax=Prevotella sp. Rep29 TaxID=2691580 RepID=UPI001C6E38A7|nr:Bax inhibitor-1/YccA family protein [Prevotella sp. Rep29]QYR10554.1 BAX inhibitor (BI)-1/YccA family protein [Prevotella sp. Rep29]
MNEKNWEQMVREKERVGYDKMEMASLAFPALMRKVYLWMTLALAITGITAYGVANNSSLIWTLMENSWMLWGLLIVELALVFVISGMIKKLSLTTATILFIIYSLLNGVVFSSIFLVYTDASISKVFFITAGTFAAMSLIGYTTKRDLSSMGRILFMALIGLIIATIVNIFLKSSGLDMILSYLGVLIFVGLTAWDTQEIKNMLLECEEPNEEAQKIALLGSLSLYLDFINLFIYLLRIFGSRE